MDSREGIPQHRAGFVSKLRPPTKSAVREAPLPRALKRRSKSASDLRARPERVLQTRQRLETIHANNVLTTSNTSIAGGSRLEPFLKGALVTTDLLQPGLRRRSKSVTDLTTNKTSTAVNSAPKIVKKVLPVSVRNVPKIQSKTNTGIKRALPENKVDAPKPKVVRTARIPAYDYKARFQHLEAAHEKLKTLYEASQTDFANYNEAHNARNAKSNQIEERNKALENANEDQLHEIMTLKTENTTLSSANDGFRNKLTDLSSNNRKLEAEVQVKNCTLEKLSADLTRAMQSNESARSELWALQKSNKELTVQAEKNGATIGYLTIEVEKKDLIRQKLHNSIQDLKGNIRVFCRVRGALLNENKNLALIKCADDTVIEIRRLAESVNAISGRAADIKLEFSFDHVFDCHSTQNDIFNEVAELIQSGLDGFNICIFAYGQTGSGKTYTMQGEAENEGVIPRALRVIFNYGDKKSQFGWTFSIRASFLEIYNETLNDLLNIKYKDHLEIYYNEGKGVSVKNLTIEPVQNYEELIKLMGVAQKNRTVAATDFNLHSSRSHAVTQIHITATKASTNIKLKSIINLVDLAGSESAKTSSQERLTETKSINKSLSTLGTVINDLGTGKTHIPYRNSKLTFLLQSCLGGNSKTLMIVHISPTDESYPESISSLRFASKVKTIKTNSKRNKTTI